MTDSPKAEMWRKHIKDYRKSKESAEIWCKNNDLKLGRLRYWIRKFNKEKRIMKQEWVSIEEGIIGESVIEKPIIEKVIIEKPVFEESSKVITIRIGTASIEVPDGFNTMTLCSVLKSLGVHYD